MLCLPAHAALPSIRDFYESASLYYVLTGGKPSNTLRMATSKERSLCERDVSVVVSDLLASLLQLRSTRLVHRFICPDTIAIDQDEIRVRGVSLTDF